MPNPDRLLGFAAVERRVTWLGRSRLLQVVNERGFPAPVGPDIADARVRLWWERDVDAWIRANQPGHGDDDPTAERSAA